METLTMNFSSLRSSRDNMKYKPQKRGGRIDNTKNEITDILTETPQFLQERELCSIGKSINHCHHWGTVTNVVVKGI
jgi:hypothetical protein